MREIQLLHYRKNVCTLKCYINVRIFFLFSFYKVISYKNKKIVSNCNVQFVLYINTTPKLKKKFFSIRDRKNLILKNMKNNERYIKSHLQKNNSTYLRQVRIFLLYIFEYRFH